MTCRYDRATRTHLLSAHTTECVDTECRGCLPCTHDDDGNPVRHCRAWTRCRAHLGWDEYACERCVEHTRKLLGKVVDLLALMPAVAVESGRVDSPAAVQAGPHADHVSASWRLINADREGQIVEELDMADPYTCLTMHERLIREELGHDGTVLVSPSIGEAVSYLSWALTDLALSEDGALLLAALRGDGGRLRAMLELIAALRPVPTRGAPCPTCRDDGHVVRLERRYAWATHDRLDTWVCPREPAHVWGQHAYEAEIVDRKRAG